MSITTIDSKFISDMLISEKGTINQNHPVGNWWFNRSLGNIKNNYYSYNMDNLTELLFKIEGGLSDFNIIPNIENCDYKASIIAYDKIKENQLKYWSDESKAYKAITNLFYIDVKYFDEFCTIIANSINTAYFNK